MSKSTWKRALEKRFPSSLERWKWYLKEEYGLTYTQYNEMVARQGGKCAICGSEERLCVDHNHETGAIRGLLCSPCNYSLIGAIEKAGLRKAQKAIRYLKNSKK